MKMIFMLELRRMRLPLAVGAIVSALALGLMYLVPMDQGLFQIAVLVCGILLPSLWFILLFEPLADDREQLAFLGGLPVSLHRVFWLRILLRMVLLVATTALLWRAIGFVGNWGVSVAGGDRNRNTLESLFGVWLGISGWLILLSLLRARPKMPKRMPVVLAAAVLVQILAVTFYAEINTVHYILLAGLQAFCLSVIAAWQFWRGACFNRRIGWWVAALLLLPVLQYGGVSAYWNTRAHIAVERAKAAGIMIFPEKPGSTAEVLQQFGYRPGADPVYHAGFNWRFQHELQQETMNYYWNDEFDKFFANLEIEWFLFGFDPHGDTLSRICHTVQKKSNQLEWFRRMVEYLEKTRHRKMDNRLILSFNDYTYWDTSGTRYGAGGWYLHGIGFLIQPGRAKIKTRVFEGTTEALRSKKGEQVPERKDNMKYSWITGWNTENVDGMIGILKLRIYQLEHGEFPKSLPPEIAGYFKNSSYQNDGQRVWFSIRGSNRIWSFQYRLNEESK